MKLLVDAQLPQALAEWLRDQGLSADHLAELGLLSASDGEIWDLALSKGYVIVTKDRDFVRMVAAQDAARQGAVGSVWKYEPRGSSGANGKRLE